MTAINAFIKRHPVATYFALTFTISWGGVLLVMGGPGAIPATKEQFWKLLPIWVPVLLAGPSLAGILLTGLVHGRAGFRELLSRLLRWRVGARWYAAAILTAPLLFAATLLALSPLSSRFLPGIVSADDKAAHLIAGLAIGLVAGIFEELGWTGFAVPGLRRRFGVFTTGLIVGLLWAGWHLIMAVVASGTTSGELNLTSYLLDPFLFLVGFRVLMVWVYDRTGSLLLAMLMHMSLTAGSRIFCPLGIAGAPLLTFDLVWAAAVLLLVGAAAAAGRRPGMRQMSRHA